MAIERVSGSGVMNAMTGNGGATTKVDNAATASEGQASQIKVERKDTVSAEREYSGSESQQNSEETEGTPIQEVSPEKIKAAINEVNSKIRPTRTECKYSYHEETHRISIKVFDQDTGDVIREIPPEKALDMVARAWELAGFLVDEKR